MILPEVVMTLFLQQQIKDMIIISRQEEKVAVLVQNPEV